ncbi:MAG TPA: hypothetical protein VGH50_14390, partial [Candidatus Binatia bacterium]
MLTALVSANPELTTGVLRELLDDMKLHYQDPITDVIFETTPRSRVLLSLVGEIVQGESQLIQLRIRALEALFTRLALGRRAFRPAAPVEETLRSLNDILAEVNRDAATGVAKNHDRLAKELQSVSRMLPALTRNPPADAAGAAENRGQSSHREIIDLLETVLQQPSGSMTADYFATLLRILRLTTQLPEWRPANAGADRSRIKAANGSRREARLISGEPTGAEPLD